MMDILETIKGIARWEDFLIPVTKIEEYASMSDRSMCEVAPINYLGGIYRLDPITSIFHIIAMRIGMPTLASDNLKEWGIRTNLVQDVSGAFFNKNGKDHFLVYEDLKRRIGYRNPMVTKTNWITFTRTLREAAVQKFNIQKKMS